MFVEGKPRTVFFLQTNTLFTAFIATVEKIITYALGEHDPGSAQDWRTSNDFCSPDSRNVSERSTSLDVFMSWSTLGNISQIYLRTASPRAFQTDVTAVYFLLSYFDLVNLLDSWSLEHRSA